MASLTVLSSSTRYPAAHGALVVRPLPGYGAHLGRYAAAHRALVGRPLPGYGAPLDRYPGRAGHTGTVHIALIAEHPQHNCSSELTQSTSEQSLN